MSLIFTLFGGIVLVLVLHGILGKMGVANYWRGVISGAVPSFVFLGYSLFHAMTLDILSIHLALYLSTATVTTMVVGARKKSSGDIHWAIKTMIVFFLVLFIVDGAFVSISVNGVPPGVAALFLPNASKKPVYTGFTGVTRHGEEAASAESALLKAQNQMRKLGWKIEIDGVSHLSTRPDASNTIRLKMLDPQQLPVNGAQISVQLMRADNQLALPPVTLQPVADGEYSGNLVITSGGNWLMRTSILVEGNHIQMDKDVRVATK